MSAIEIFSKVLIMLYSEIDNNNYIPLKGYICSIGDISLSKLTTILETFKELDLIEINLVTGIEIYGKIKGGGMLIVEKCENNEIKLSKMLDDYFESKLIKSNIINSFNNNSNSNIANSTQNLNQGIKNEE